MIVLRPVLWPEARERWQWLRTGLQECIRRTGERWLPEDIYGPLRDGTAYCYAVVRGDRDIGFVILQRHNDPDGSVLFVWALWCEAGQLLPELQGLLDALEELARAVKVARLRMESPREGYKGVQWWKPVRTVYEHEVSDGTKQTT